MVYSSAGAALVSLLLSSITAGAIAQVVCDDIDARCRKKTVVASFDQDDLAAIDRYYEIANGVTGEPLRNTLNEIIRKNYVRYNYRDECVWKAIFEADEDENNPGNVIAIYSRTSIPKLYRICLNGEEDDRWNKEHVWAKAHGFPARVRADFAYSDLHNLVAADKSVNRGRDTRDFKEGGTSEMGDCDRCKQVGKQDPDKPNVDAQYSFEPPNNAKGQVARIMFYMYTRYNGAGNDQNDRTELDLVDRKTLSSDGKGEFGYLSDLLKWHCQVPVTPRERKRNDIIQTYQGNRNPFVDRPEYVEMIWGDKYPSIFEECNNTIRPPVPPSVPPSVPPPLPPPLPQPLPQPLPPTAQVWINEFHYENRGVDEDEFVEIGCNTAVDVSNYMIFLYGKDGKMRIDGTGMTEIKILQGQCTPDTFVFQDYGTNNLVNKGMGIALVDATEKLLDFISYEGTVVGRDGPAAGSSSTDVVVEQSNRSTSKDESIQLVNKVGATRTCEKTDFEWKLQTRSKGKRNNGQTINCSPPVWINEFHYENIGADEDEFVEIGCSSAVDVSNYKIYIYGKDGTASSEDDKDKTKTLQGQCTPDTFVFQDYGTNNLANKGRGIALVDASGKLLDFISYEGTVVGRDGPATGLSSTDVIVEQSNSSTRKDESIQLVNKVGATRTCEKTDFEWKLQTRSKGKRNSDQTINCSSKDEL
jgi:endonuclease I